MAGYKRSPTDFRVLACALATMLESEDYLTGAERAHLDESKALLFKFTPTDGEWPAFTATMICCLSGVGDAYQETEAAAKSVLPKPGRHYVDQAVKNFGTWLIMVVVGKGKYAVVGAHLMFSQTAPDQPTYPERPRRNRADP